MTKYLLLTISGFHIKIAFKPARDLAIQTRLISEIAFKYKGYISKNSSLRNDFKITFTDQKMNIVNFIPDNQSKSIYLLTNFYEKKGTNYYETYYHISIYQFNHLLFSVIEKLLSFNRGFILNGNVFLHSQKAILILTNQKAILPKSLQAFLTYKVTIRNLVFVRLIKTHFFVFPNPFISDKKNNTSYRVERVILCRNITGKTNFVRISDKNAYMNKIITISNIPKYSHSNIESTDIYTKSMQTILSFMGKIDLWKFNIGKKSLPGGDFQKFLNSVS